MNLAGLSLPIVAIGPSLIIGTYAGYHPRAAVDDIGQEKIGTDFPRCKG